MFYQAVQGVKQFVTDVHLFEMAEQGFPVGIAVRMWIAALTTNSAVALIAGIEDRLGRFTHTFTPIKGTVYGVFTAAASGAILLTAVSAMNTEQAFLLVVIPNIGLQYLVIYTAESLSNKILNQKKASSTSAALGYRISTRGE
jgi:hypothetical protein